MPAIQKLSRKQQKASAFKKGLIKKKDKPSTEDQDKPGEPVAAKPKKPTTKKFILFVGNLPFEITEKELTDHFKSVTIDKVRPRKGFAFIELANAEQLHAALKFHHSELKYRKINVELTAGGGGNSKARKAKLDKKNTALRKEIAEKIAQEEKVKQEKKKNQKENDLEGIHPSRRANFNK